MGYVLVRQSDGRYVSRSGNESSYTKRLEQARTFKTAEIARANACGNEFVQSLADIMGL